jgi:hypothetical protein
MLGGQRMSALTSREMSEIDRLAVEETGPALLQMAMMGDLPYTVLRDAVIAHPTLAESLNNLFMMLDS